MRAGETLNAFIGTQTMTHTEKWKELCAKAAVEKDPQRLLELVREINRILEEIENKGKRPGHSTQ